ncbi:hypothetical protein [Luteimonas padinae]|uniref:hypothetical protein n=1 Tax=Luteimonas padinae TaxID=1714359 RepID=UPI0016745ED3|nr:hypothetical protein [Luteimonas padinae]
MRVLLPRIYADAPRIFTDKAKAFFCHGFTRINADLAEASLGEVGESGSPRTVAGRSEPTSSGFCSIRFNPRKSVAKNAPRFFCSSRFIRVDPRRIRVNPWQKNGGVSR